jgi:hypothetical protein
LWSRKWRESWKIDSEEEVMLTAVQEKVSSENKEKSQSAQRWRRRRVRKRSRRLRGRVTEGQFKFGFRAGVKDRF